MSAKLGIESVMRLRPLLRDARRRPAEDVLLSASDGVFELTLPARRMRVLALLKCGSKVAAAPLPETDTFVSPGVPIRCFLRPELLLVSELSDDMPSPDVSEAIEGAGLLKRGE